MTFYLQPFPARRMARRWVEQDRSLALNVREEEDAYILSALVPGLSAEDLEIQVLEDVVRIQGEFPSLTMTASFCASSPRAASSAPYGYR